VSYEALFLAFLGCIGLCLLGLWLLLSCWGNGLEGSSSLCILVHMGEKNGGFFEGKERNLLEIKGMLIHSLKEWLAVAGLVPQSSTIGSLDFCKP
jgi:hypothetical protein